MCHRRLIANDNASGNLTLFILAKLFSSIGKKFINAYIEIYIDARICWNGCLLA